MQGAGQIELRLLAIERRAELAQGVGDTAGGKAHALLIGVTTGPRGAGVTTTQLGPLEDGQYQQRNEEQPQQGDGDNGWGEDRLAAIEWQQGGASGHVHLAAYQGLAIAGDMGGNPGGAQTQHQTDRGQQQGACHHGARHFAGVARFLAARCAAEADAIHLDETHHRHGAGHRQHHYRERRDDRGAEFGHGEQRLVDKPLADKAVERRQRRDGHGTDEERQRGPGHQLGQPPHLVHVAGVQAEHHRAGAHKEQALEDGVVEQVIEGAEQPQHHQCRLLVGDADHADPHPHQDDADVLHRVVGEQPLEIVLGQRKQHPEHCRAGTEDQHHIAPPELAGAEEIDADPQDAKETQLHHDAGHQRRDMGRRNGLGHRQPAVQRHETGAQAKAAEAEQEHQGGQTARQMVLAQRGELQRAAFAAEQPEGDQHQRHADMVHHQVEAALFGGLGVGLDQPVGGEGHQLVAEQETERVVGQYHAHHGKEEEVHQRADGHIPLALIFADIGKGVEGDGDADGANHQQHQRGQHVEVHRAQQPELAVDGGALGKDLDGGDQTRERAQQGKAAIEAVGQCGQLLQQQTGGSAQQKEQERGHNKGGQHQRTPSVVDKSDAGIAVAGAEKAEAPCGLVSAACWRRIRAARSVSPSLTSFSAWEGQAPTQAGPSVRNSHRSHLTAMLRTPGSQLSRSSPKQRRPAEVEGLLERMEQGI